MPQQYSFVGQRADKISVEGVADAEAAEDEDVIIVDGRIVKKVEHYTVRCPECDSVGRYDNKGQIVCEDDSCGVVISGDEQPTLAVDYSNSRGFTGKRDSGADGDNPNGITQPSI